MGGAVVSAGVDRVRQVSGSLPFGSDWASCCCLLLCCDACPRHVCCASATFTTRITDRRVPPSSGVWGAWVGACGWHLWMPYGGYCASAARGVAMMWEPTVRS